MLLRKTIRKMMLMIFLLDKVTLKEYLATSQE